MPDELHYLPVIDGRSSVWTPKVAALEKSGRNFIIGLSDPDREVPELCATLNADPCVPEKLSRWMVYGLRSALHPDHFRSLRDWVMAGESWYLVEQIKLLPKRRAENGNYLVMCELLGIVAETHGVEDAKRALVQYYAAFPPAALHPLGGIYEWDGDRWKPTRLFF
jgi:hypothetical protein